MHQAEKSQLRERVAHHLDGLPERNLWSKQEKLLEELTGAYIELHRAAKLAYNEGDYELLDGFFE